MTDTKWTEGQWTNYEKNRNDERIVSTSDRLICTCHHECVGALEKEMEANATLIAAAPELYEALEPLDEWATEHVVEAKEWSPKTTVQIQLSIGDLRAARAALAKARGEDQ